MGVARLPGGYTSRVTRARIIGVVCIALAALPAASAPASAAETIPTIQWAGDQVTRIGSLRTASKLRLPSIARAITAFGRPSTTKRTSRVACTLTWRTLGLRATFVSLGGAYPTKATCVARVGVMQTATVFGTGLKTQGGLQVGDTVDRLRELHPEAYFQDGCFWLATAPAVMGSTSRSQRTWIVRALTDSGIVRRIGLRIGAAGAGPVG
jgi:hypothetical protein